MCYASELGDDQDGGGHKGRREDWPGLRERLFQCVYGMGVVFDGVTQGPSVEVRQPVNERGSENGENDPRLFQMPGCRGDDCGGHHGARDHTLAVDHPQWVAVRLPPWALRGGLHSWSFGGKSIPAPSTRQACALVIL